MVDMQNLSIIIPYRASSSSQRGIIFDWMIKRYKELFSESEIIIADSGDLYFNRSKSRNVGASQAHEEFILIADADTMPYPDAVKTGLEMIEAGSPWLFLYDFESYYNADEESSRRILSLPPETNVLPSEITWEHKITSLAGQILMRKKDFIMSGGYDERFEGWGYEDNAFQVAADVILGKHERVKDAWTIHLWHPYSHKTTFGQPMIRKNRYLYNTYLEIGDDKKEMMKFIGSRDEL